jgi:hypothetical protein
MSYLTIAKYVGGTICGLALAWIFYAGLIRPTTKPNPTTTQKADTMVNYTFNNTPRSTFGCNMIRINKIPTDKIK